MRLFGYQIVVIGGGIGSQPVQTKVFRALPDHVDRNILCTTGGAAP